MRLNRYLALCGIASRRKCEKYILQGDVSVNGSVIKSLSTLIDPKKDAILFTGNLIQLPSHFDYYVLNKPIGFLSSTSDTHNRETVYSLLKDIKERVFHVGRLDQNSEGLLLFTNDGKLSHRLLHPKYNVPKRYLVKVSGFLTDKGMEKLIKGVKLEEGKTNPADVELIQRSEQESIFYIMITQGWKRQIRRMLKSIDLQVIYLRRETFGNLSLSGLPVGKWRKLTMEEIISLKSLVKPS